MGGEENPGAVDWLARWFRTVMEWRSGEQCRGRVWSGCEEEVVLFCVEAQLRLLTLG